MAPKVKSEEGTTQVFIVWSPAGIDSVHATAQSALAVLSSSKSNLAISSKDLVGGKVSLVEEKDAPAPKAKAAAKSKAVKVEAEDEDTVDTKVKKAAPKKTKTPTEQRAANADKPPKAKDADLPDNVKALLKNGGNAFEGQTVIVTGIPPTLGRKNAERLVEAFGAHLGKSLSRKTNYVVVGNDAGPKKLLQIEELGLKTLDEDELVALLERGLNSKKRESSNEEDEEDEDEDEEEAKPKVKRPRK